MILGNQVEWALHCAAFLAQAPGDTPIPVKTLAEYHDIPREYLAKAMQALAAAGLVVSTSGPRGGYRLAKAADCITVLDVVEAVEGREGTFRCTEIRKQGPCRRPGQKYSPVCAIAATMYKADRAWRQSLAGTTLADIVQVVARTVRPDDAARSVAWLERQLDR
jgi:Rrf2 family protein